MQSKHDSDNPEISVGEFVKNAPAELKLEITAGKKGVSSRFINSSRIQKLGLALAGFDQYIHQGRVQLVGQSEISFLEQLSKKKRIEAVNNLALDKISCVLITKKLEISKEFLEIAGQNGIPVLRTPLVSSRAIKTVSNYLEDALAPKTTLHSVLLGMHGIGVLLIGKSGIGKSECALDLISRGHHLISDDTVLVKKIGDVLEGSSPDLTAEHLEIRGLGILNIRDLFGVSSIGRKKTIDLCIEFKKWDEVFEVERLGLETHEEEILGIKIPKFVLPVSSGRNLSTLVETAVRIYLLKPPVSMPRKN